MANVVYFDAFNGVAGDMILGALIDLGLPPEVLSGELRKLQLSGWDLLIDRTEREGLSGVNLRVKYEEESGGGHGHHKHRHFSRIREIIQASELDGWVKETSIRIFTRLAEAEAKVHGSSIEEVRFHEVGAIDAIVDIVGSCIGFRYLGVEEFLSSALELGGGTVTFSHGTWPVPTPATAELVKEFPVRMGAAEVEMTTPTGAAIVTTLSGPRSVPGSFRIRGTGLGAGDRVLPGIPNMLRLILGETIDTEEIDASPVNDSASRDRIVVLEMNIDDMIAEDTGNLMDRVLEEGALDIFFTPVFMKKNRPGVQVTVLSPLEREEHLVDLLFRETSSLGIRRKVTERHTLERETFNMDTEYGEVCFKKARFQGRILQVTPEFDDLKRISVEKGISLRELRAEIMKRVSDESFE